MAWQGNDAHFLDKNYHNKVHQWHGEITVKYTGLQSVENIFIKAYTITVSQINAHLLYCDYSVNEDCI
jgi:hypothetical protein